VRALAFGEAEAAQWFFDHASDLFTVVSAEGRFVSVNAAWTALTGWTTDETIGQPTLKFIHPDSQDLHRHRPAHARDRRGDQPSCGPLQGRPLDLAAGTRAPGAQWRDDRRCCTTSRPRWKPAPRWIAARRTRALLAEAAGIGVWSYEPEGEHIDWSPDALALLGLSPSDIATADMFVARLPDDQRETGARGLPTTPRDRRGRHDRVPAARRQRLLADLSQHLSRRAGPAALFALKGISQNITDVARSRDKAIWSERQARRLVEDAPFAVAVYDLDLRLRLVSPRFLDLQVHRGPGHRQDPGELTHGSRKRFVTGRDPGLSGEVVTRREDQLHDAEGAEHSLRWEARPWRDGAGEIVGVITYMDDVTALTAARREARINARRLKVALGAARAGVYEIDHEGKSFWGSPEFHRMMGRRVGYDDVREAVWPMIHPEDRDGGLRRRGRVAADRPLERPRSNTTSA
jgi:PAS domain-containing protein